MSKSNPADLIAEIVAKRTSLDKDLLTHTGSYREGGRIRRVHLTRAECEALVRDDRAAGITFTPRKINNPAPILYTAEEYEAAIQQMERTFRPNKARFWVLKCLRVALKTNREDSRRAARKGRMSEVDAIYLVQDHATADNIDQKTIEAAFLALYRRAPTENDRKAGLWARLKAVVE